MYNFRGISVHFMTARPLFDSGNLWVLETGYTQLVIHLKEDFMTFKLYTKSLISRIRKI